jgi:tRNA uridine 5-carbamoylmethylation protein Kti12
LEPIFLIVGGPAVGKSSTSQRLAARFPSSVHIPVDDVRNMVVSGLVHPAVNWTPELVRQLSLARESTVLIARVYNMAGFVVVIDDFWDANSKLEEYQELYYYAYTHKVILYPSQDTAHERNLKRADSADTQQYLDEGIRQTYQSLKDAIPELEADGWLVLDTTDLSVEETVDRILEWAETGDSSW